MKTTQNSKNGTNPALKTVEAYLMDGHRSESEAMNFKLGSRKSLSFSSLIAVTGTLVLSLGLAACQPKSGQNAPTGDALAPASGPAASASVPRASGTGDSGGGNGKDGVFLEAYAFNPESRPEWKTYVGPIIANAHKIEPVMKSIGMMVLAAKSKRWYSIQVEFDKLTNEQIGLGFMQDPLQQLARQSEREVWFDKKKFETSPDQALGLELCSNTVTRDECLSRARATGLVHEALMALYTIQFMDFSEVCKKMSPDIRDCETLDKLNIPELKPKPKRHLNDKDYENIRALTIWLIENGATVRNESELRSEFLRNGFDPRMYFTIESPKNGPEKIEMSRAQIAKALTQASITERTPSTCRVARGEVMFMDQCPTTFKLVDIGGGTQAIEATVSVPKAYGSNQVKIHRVVRPLEMIPELYTLTRHKLPGARSEGYYLDLGFAIADDDKFDVGTDVHYLMVFLTEDTMTVSGAWLSAQRITGINAKIPVANSNVERVQFEHASPSETIRSDIQIVIGTIEENRKNVMGTSRSGGEIFFYPR